MGIADADTDAEEPPGAELGGAGMTGGEVDMRLGAAELGGRPVMTVSLGLGWADAVGAGAGAELGFRVMP